MSIGTALFAKSLPINPVSTVPDISPYFFFVDFQMTSSDVINTTPNPILAKISSTGTNLRLIDFSFHKILSRNSGGEFNMTVFDPNPPSLELAIWESGGVSLPGLAGVGILQAAYTRGGISGKAPLTESVLVTDMNVSIHQDGEALGDRISLHGYSFDIAALDTKRTHVWVKDNSTVSGSSASLSGPAVGMTIFEMFNAICNDHGWNGVMQDADKIKEFDGMSAEEVDKIFHQTGQSDIEFLNYYVSKFAIPKDKTVKAISGSSFEGAYKTYFDAKINTLYYGTDSWLAFERSKTVRTYLFPSGRTDGQVISFSLQSPMFIAMSQGKTTIVGEEIDTYKKYWHRMELHFEDLYGVSDPALESIHSKNMRFSRKKNPSPKVYPKRNYTDNLANSIRNRYNYICNLAIFQADMTVVGDTTLDAGIYVNIQINNVVDGKAGLPHYASGYYYVPEIIHNLSQDGSFTSTLKNMMKLPDDFVRNFVKGK